MSFNLKRDWYVTETTHFVFYYHAEIEDFAERMMDIMENKAYVGIAERLGFKPERKIYVVLGDFDDIGNGFAVELLDFVFISSADIYFIPLRGRHQWLGDVAVHELTHIFTLKKIKKTSELVPFVVVSGGFFCVLDPLCAIRESRGKATLVGSFVAGAVPYSEPAYFTEGIAQLLSAELGYDSLDSYREMFLRTLFYHGKLRSLRELGNFEGKFGIEAEHVYNHGFSFLTFIKEKYGWDAIQKVLDISSGFFRFSYQKAFESAIGKSFEDLEEEWKKWLEERYAPVMERYSRKHRVGELVEIKPKKVGFYKEEVHFVYQPRPYGDGILLIQGRDLVFYRDGRSQIIASGVQSYAVQGTMLAISYPKRTGKLFFLGSVPETYLTLAVGYLVEEDGKKGKKLVFKGRRDIAQRAAFPSISPDGRRIAFLRTEVDSRNIFVYDLEEGREVRLTAFGEGKQFAFPSFSPDNGRSIVASYFDGRKQDIVIIPSYAKEPVSSENDLFFLTKDSAEDRDPVFVNESMVSFSSDRDGVFNIYVMDIISGRTWKVTEEISGCLFTFPVSEGEFLYVAFEPTGYRPKRIRASRESWEEVGTVLEDLQVTSDEGEPHKSDATLNRRRAEPVRFVRPIFIPSFGLELNPLLTSISTSFFVPLDIIGVSVEGLTFDVLGRMQASIRGSVGLRGSFSIFGGIESYHFSHFIPSLLLGFYRYRLMPVADLDSFGSISEGWNLHRFIGALPVRIPIFYASENNQVVFLIAPLVEVYIQKVEVGGLSYKPFGFFYSARSIRGVFGIGGIRSFRFPVGRLLASAQLFAHLFRTSSMSFLEQHGIALYGQRSESYLTGSSELDISSAWMIPLDRRREIRIFSDITLGYSMRNVDSVDEFIGFYPGYFQAFFGDSFVQWRSGVLLDIWSGYLVITDTSALHMVSVESSFSLFRFVRQEDDKVSPPSFRETFLGRYYSDITVGVILRASVFYRYSVLLNLVVARGFQDPLVAPFRLYFGVGLGL